MDIKKLNQEIADAEERVKQLKATKKEFEGMEPMHQLALTLHSMLCRWNHTDGCSWHYEITKSGHDWKQHAHAEYLKKAQTLTSWCERNDVPEHKALGLMALINNL